MPFADVRTAKQLEGCSSTLLTVLRLVITHIENECLA